MRRSLGVVVLVLGLLLVVAAPVMRWYVAPQLATAPTDESFSSPAEGTAAVLFDLATGAAGPERPVDVQPGGDARRRRQHG